MTIAEKLNILDAFIAQMSSYLSRGSSYNDSLYNYGNIAKKNAIETLKKIGAPKYSIDSIKNISFESYRDEIFGHHYGEYEMKSANRCNAYKQSVNSVISILNQERTRLIKEQADTEQRKDKQMAKWTLICSAVAAICAIISLLFTIFN